MILNICNSIILGKIYYIDYQNGYISYNHQDLKILLMNMNNSNMRAVFRSNCELLESIEFDNIDDLKDKIPHEFI